MLVPCIQNIQSLLIVEWFLHQLCFLYSIIVCNFSSSHSLTRLQMLNLALIPKQQEFESPSSLTHRITSHPQTTFHSSQTCTQKQRERGRVLHNDFIKYTRQKWAAKERGQNKNRWAALWRVLIIFSPSLLVLKINTQGKHVSWCVSVS